MIYFEIFYEKLRDVVWANPSDVLKTFGFADIVSCSVSNRIVFNLGGNRYRLVTGYYFGRAQINLNVKFVGTHSEYDKIEVCEVNMFKK